MQTAVLIDQVHFRYSKRTQLCLENISLKIFAGERFGLFGPNGAGKTTLISIMTGLLRPKSGSVQLFGTDVNADRKTKSLFGYVPQDLAFYDELTPVENLEFFGAWSGLNRIQIKKRTDELLTVLGLNEVRNKVLKSFSGGMKRRLNIAIGVIHEPKILFLDEPTVGVDVQTRIAIIDYLKQLNAQGATLIYTSHLLQEAQDLCKHIALIDNGKIILNDDLEKLLHQHEKSGLEELFLNLTGSEYRD
ncbi:MAG: ABC transporter ATP-binding protein [Bacteroidia bacterium]|nr:ABC transporter ATP-binding protein [Bacteroidia bacterium]